MSSTVKVSFLPSGTTVAVPTGTTMLEAAIRARVPVSAICGGRGTCHKCKVLAPDYPGPIRRAERDAFTAAELAAGWRLACVCKVHADLAVEAPPVEDYATKSFWLGRGATVPLKPAVQRWQVTPPPPSLADQRSDWQRLRDALPADQELTAAPGVLRTLPAILRRAQWSVAVTAVGDTVVAVEPAHRRPPLGLAVDIGTTSLVAMLVDLSTGAAAAVAARSNSQSVHGGDVMARIDFSNSPGGVKTLQREVAGDLMQIVRDCCSQVAARPRDIYEVTVVANTTMAHLFLGLSPRQVGVSPFVGVTSDAVTVPAADLGLRLNPAARVHVLPGVAGFVGADTIGVALATGLQRTARTVAAVDVGTNVEVVLAHQGRLLTCSAPAGPAFEGGQIRQGMRATAGAVSTFALGPDGVRYTTVGDAPARGICGSALVDVCAALCEYGLINPGGRLLNAADLARSGHPDPLGLAGRVVELDGGIRAFILVPAAETAIDGPILLTQLDIRQYQLAKAATLAALRVALIEMGLTAGDLDEVIMAGTFGSHIGAAQAVRSGLIPPVPVERVRYVGNAAHEGARMALLNVDYRREAAALARRLEHVESAARPDFQDIYVDSLGFPEPDEAPGAPSPGAAGPGAASGGAGRAGEVGRP